MLTSSLFNTSMDWVLSRVEDQCHCGASVSNTEITDLIFADAAAIFPGYLEVLVLALEALHEEVKPLGLKVQGPRCLESYWMKQYSLSIRKRGH